MKKYGSVIFYDHHQLLVYADMLIYTHVLRRGLSDIVYSVCPSVCVTKKGIVGIVLLYLSKFANDKTLDTNKHHVTLARFMA